MEKKGGKSLSGLPFPFEGDKVVWIIVLMLMLISIVCIFSSTSQLLEGTRTRVDIVREHMYIVLGGLAIIVVCYLIRNIRFYRWLSKFGFLFSLCLLIPLVAKVDLGFIKSVERNDARRILELAGGLQIHVFEVVKVAMVMYLAWALDAFKKGELKGPEKKIWKKILYIYGPFVITFSLVITGSISAALFIGGIMAIEILLGGGNFKDMCILGAGAVMIVLLCFGIYKASGETQMKRIGVGLSRTFRKEDYVSRLKNTRFGSVEYYKCLDKVRQPEGAAIAVREGGILGKGPGQSTQRYVVPDMPEDYMFSFIIEEYGIWGALIVIFLYVSLLARGSIIVRNSGNDLYAKLAVGGLCLLITGQAFLHMFVNVRIGPMTGQTLPLISHGDCAFLCFSIAFGIIISFSRIAKRRIDRETRSAVPIFEAHEEVGAAMNDLDEFDKDDYGI